MATDLASAAANKRGASASASAVGGKSKSLAAGSMPVRASTEAARKTAPSAPAGGIMTGAVTAGGGERAASGAGASAGVGAGGAGAGKTPPEDLDVFVQDLLDQMQARFSQMGDSILGRIDAMGNQIDELERSVKDLMDQAGVEVPPASTSTVGGGSGAAAGGGSGGSGVGGGGPDVADGRRA